MCRRDTPGRPCRGQPSTDSNSPRDGGCRRRPFRIPAPEAAASGTAAAPGAPDGRGLCPGAAAPLRRRGHPPSGLLERERLRLRSCRTCVSEAPGSRRAGAGAGAKSPWLTSHSGISWAPGSGPSTLRRGRKPGPSRWRASALSRRRVLNLRPIEAEPREEADWGRRVPAALCRSAGNTGDSDPVLTGLPDAVGEAAAAAAASRTGAARGAGVGRRRARAPSSRELRCPSGRAAGPGAAGWGAAAARGGGGDSDHLPAAMRTLASARSSSILMVLRLNSNRGVSAVSFWKRVGGRGGAGMSAGGGKAGRGEGAGQRLEGEAIQVGGQRQAIA